MPQIRKRSAAAWANASRSVRLGRMAISLDRRVPPRNRMPSSPSFQPAASRSAVPAAGSAGRDVPARERPRTGAAPAGRGDRGAARRRLHEGLAIEALRERLAHPLVLVDVAGPGVEHDRPLDGQRAGTGATPSAPASGHLVGATAGQPVELAGAAAGLRRPRGRARPASSMRPMAGVPRTCAGLATSVTPSPGTTRQAERAGAERRHGRVDQRQRRGERRSPRR